MHILTNRLVRLDGRDLPLPWYHRAPLGLLSGTPAHVALQVPQERPFGDLIVSVVDPANWPLISEITAWTPDAPGVLADVYRPVPPLNIVFAEAITVDSGSRHDVRLVVEPFRRYAAAVNDRQRLDKLKRIRAHLARKGFRGADSRPVHPAGPELAWMEVGNISLGWVHVEGWRDALDAQAKASRDAEDYDLDMAVISADTERRLLRYMFPRKGAVSVSIEHSDRPGAMLDIARALAGNRLNILSSLIRRGSAPPYKAAVGVIVEPTDRPAEEGEVKERILNALEGFDPSLRVRPKVSRCVDPSDRRSEVLYPRRPQTIAVSPTEPMEAAILAVKRSFPRDKRPIFISRPFRNLADEENAKIVRELHDALHEYDCWPVEALPQPGGELAVPEDVKAKMWASDAAIVLVFVTDQTAEERFSVNLAHETGFMQGQGKQLLPVVEEGLAETISKHANLQGLPHVAFKREEGSIRSAVAPWLDSLREPDEAGVRSPGIGSPAFARRSV